MVVFYEGIAKFSEVGAQNLEVHCLNESKVNELNGGVDLKLTDFSGFMLLFTTAPILVLECNKKTYVNAPFTFFITDEKCVNIKALGSSGIVVGLVVSRRFNTNLVTELLKEKQINFMGFKDVSDVGVLSRGLSEPLFFQQFVSFLMHSVSFLCLLSKVEKNKERMRTGGLLTRVEQAIKNNASNPNLYLDYVAKLVFCSKSAIQKTLAREGTSFSELTNRIRIELFCDYLLKTDLSIEMICYKCGFNSSSYATKLFKKLMGETPRQYRRKFVGESCGRINQRQ